MDKTYGSREGGVDRGSCGGENKESNCPRCGKEEKDSNRVVGGGSEDAGGSESQASAAENKVNTRKEETMSFDSGFDIGKGNYDGW